MASFNQPLDSNLPDEKQVGVDVDTAAIDSDGSSSIDTITALVNEDHQHDIKLRTMSWQKAAWLLCGDQVCLAIMAQTWSLSVLGWVPGIITMIVAGILFWITSITMHKYIMKHPQIKDICDFGYYVFGKSMVAYHFTAFMLLANNILLVGFHILTGAKVLNTLSDHSLCTVIFSVVVTIMGIVMSIPRTLKHVSFMSMFSGKFICSDTIFVHLLIFLLSCMHGYCYPPFPHLCWYRDRSWLRLQW